MGGMKLFSRINEDDSIASESNKIPASRIYMLEIDRICPNPAQPRKSFDDTAIIRLADSIRQYGILQPLTVRRADGVLPAPYSGMSCTVFELVAGERRLRAARLLCMKEVPCIIIDADSRLSAELAVIENLQREDLNIFEQAEAISVLINKFRMTQELIAGRLSVSQSYVANKLRLLRLSTTERETILANALTERHARALLRIPDEKMRAEALSHIIASHLNVAKAEEYIDRLLAGATEAPNSARRKLIIKDIRIFYNTIDRAIETVSGAGIPVRRERRELPDSTELIIRIPK